MKGSGYLCDPALIWVLRFSTATENLEQLVLYVFETVIYVWWIIAGLPGYIEVYSQEYRCLSLGS